VSGRSAPRERQFDRIVAGARGAQVPHATIGALAIRLRDQAQQLGLRPIALVSSRLCCSGARYLTLADRAGREWKIRVAGHFLPRRTGHPEPHLDFVSLDGAAGFDDACGWLGLISRGEIEWWKPQLRPRRKGVR
jgi:hypothetical protein